MILVRNVFRMKFGKAREAVQLWKEGLELNKRLGVGSKSPRLMTDITGDFYTLVFEMTYDSLAEFERTGKEVMANPEWQAWYRKMPEVMESGYREIFNIVSD